MGLDIDGRLSPAALGECRRAVRALAARLRDEGGRALRIDLTVQVELLASAPEPALQRACARSLLGAAASPGLDALARDEAFWRLVDALLPLLGPGALDGVPPLPRPSRPAGELLGLEERLPGGRIDLTALDGTTTVTREIPFETALDADPRVAAVLDAWASRQNGAGIVRVVSFDPLAAADEVGDRVHLIGCSTDDPLGFPIVHSAGDAAGHRYGWRPRTIGDVPIPALRSALRSSLAPPAEIQARPRLHRVRVSGPGVDMDYHRLILPLHLTPRKVGALAVAVLSIEPPEAPPAPR